MADPVSAGIMAGGSLLSGIIGGKGASSAAKQAAAAQQQALQLQQNEFNTINGEAQPFVQGGTGAFEQLLRLTGLGDSNTGMAVNGNAAETAQQQQQAGALSNLKDSPLFQSIMGSGTDAILQNAAATGGLRGGDTIYPLLACDMPIAPTELVEQHSGGPLFWRERNMGSGPYPRSQSTAAPPYGHRV